MGKSNKPAAADSPPAADDTLIPSINSQPEKQDTNQPPVPQTEAADVTVRILVATEVGDKAYQPNQLVRFTADVYASLDKARLDDSEAAVAYLESIGVVVVNHDEQGDNGEQS